MCSAALAAFGEALAAVSTAIAAFLADETAAECSQATLQATTTAAPGLSRWWLLLVLHLLLRGGVVIVAALRRSIGLVNILSVTQRKD
jgi:hypothetical protein